MFIRVFFKSVFCFRISSPSNCARTGAGGRKHRRPSLLRPRRHRVVFQTLRAGQPQCGRLKRTSPARWPLSVRLFAWQPAHKLVCIRPAFCGAVVLPACDAAAPRRPMSHVLPRCAASASPASNPLHRSAQLGLFWALCCLLGAHRTRSKHACVRNIKMRPPVAVPSAAAVSACVLPARMLQRRPCH